MKIVRNILLAIFVVACLAYVNIIIPKPQQISAKTYDQDKGYLAQEFPCASGNTNVIHIGDEESPSCPTGNLSDVTSYQGGVNISLTNTKNWYRIHTSWGSYYCPELGNGSCMENPKLTQGTVTLKPGDYVKVYADKRDDVQKSCGAIQEDMSFTADVSYDQGKTWSNNACGFGSMDNPGNNNSTYTWCNTNVKCSSVKPTPTPTQFHYTCENNACAKKDGPGDSTCSTQNDCSHLTCQNNSCTRVTGAGQDSCNTEGATCGQIQHMACQDNACRLVPGAGAPQCSQDSDCATPPPHLIVIKDVHNNHGGTKMSKDFMIHVDGNSVSPSDFPGPDYPFSVTISEGNYQVTEAQLPGYTLTSSEGCSGYIHNGETITCTLVNEDIPASLTVIKVVNNNHGGTKQPSDFVLRVNGTQVINNTSYAVNPGDYTVSEDDMPGYHQVSDSCGDGHIHLNAGENRVCILMNEDNGGGACTMPTCNTNISGCSYPYPDTTTCSCGPLVCVTQTPSQPNITINVSQQQQQQQQQAVLGAQVGPAITSAKKLPATGSDAEVLFGLLGLLPIGFKLRKFI